jgi:membrane protease subunit HflK
MNSVMPITPPYLAGQAFEPEVIRQMGQSSRFSQVYEQYKKAPDVTRQRIYLETMERVLGGTDKTIIDTGGQPNPGVVRPTAPSDGRQPMRPSLAGDQVGNSHFLGADPPGKSLAL